MKFVEYQLSVIQVAHWYYLVNTNMREKQRETEIERETERDREIDRETERQREKERQRDRERQRQRRRRQRQAQRDRERQREAERQRETERDRKRISFNTFKYSFGKSRRLADILHSKDLPVLENNYPKEGL